MSESTQILAKAKLADLKRYLRQLPHLAIAFSGGVDSSFLLDVAAEMLDPTKLLAVTARSSLYPKHEFDEAVAFAHNLRVSHKTIEFDGLTVAGFAQNAADRCYVCKRALLKGVLSVARKAGIRTVADGANTDDAGDYRPGRKAVKELGVLSPLEHCELSKSDIRFLSQERGLTTWAKPSFACLASRIPYGQQITTEMLARIEKAEQFLFALGFKQVRVRIHGDLARVEVDPVERMRFFEEERLDTVSAKLKELGFLYVTLDMAGYVSGSLNAVLSTQEKKIYSIKVLSLK